MRYCSFVGRTNIALVPVHDLGIAETKIGGIVTEKETGIAIETGGNVVIVIATVGVDRDRDRDRKSGIGTGSGTMIAGTGIGGTEIETETEEEKGRSHH